MSQPRKPSRAHKGHVVGASIWQRNGRYSVTFTETITQILWPGHSGRKTPGQSDGGGPFNDRRTAEEFAREHVNRAQRIRSGLEDLGAQRVAEQAGRPLGEHLEEWKQTLLASGTGEKHVNQSYVYAKAVLDHDHVLRFDQLSASGVQRAVGDLCVGKSDVTKNRYLGAIRQFVSWGFTDKRWPVDPLTSVKKFDQKAGQDRPRRPFERKEFVRLITVTARDNVVRVGVDAPTRILLYRFAAASGLRISEVARVVVRDLVRDGDRSGVWVKAVRGRKNRRRLFVGLDVDLVADLLAHAARHVDQSNHLFEYLPYKPSHLIKGDVEAAGIEYETPEGRLDSHAFRHTCASWLLSSGVGIKAVQAHLRHATAKMTLDVYGHLLREDEHTAANAATKTGRELLRIAQRFGAFQRRRVPPNAVSVTGEIPAKSPEKPP